ncbi:MAG: DUF4139 domain-containing protein [Candidatus Eiseniibacteriota bacterium]
MRPWMGFAVAMALVGLAAPAWSQGKVAGKEATGAGAPSVGAQGRDVAVTVYNENLGVVKDRRKFSLTNGTSELRFTDVASLIDPTSVHLRPLGKASVEVISQDYRYDLVSTDKLLERYLDQPIDVSTKDDQVKRGTLMSYDPSSLVIQDQSGGLSLLNRLEVRQVGLKELPKGLITRPTLVWKLKSDAGGDQPLEVSYMTGGLDWHAEYVAVINEAGTSLDLQGWASVENHSGATYDDAKIKLVAGSIHRAPPPMMPMPDYARAGVAMDRMAKMEERGFFEYHLYEVPMRATLSNNEVKQLGLLQADGIKSTKKFTYDGQRDAKQVMVTVEFENSTAAGLGMPLPAGVVRVFQRDKDESLELAGEDRIDHTPKNEKVRVSVGGAFDIAAERKQTDMKQVTNRLVETGFEIKLTNHKAEPVEVIVVEHAYGDWEVLEPSTPFTKKDATTFEFVAKCLPEKPFVLTYRLRTKS